MTQDPTFQKAYFDLKMVVEKVKATLILSQDQTGNTTKLQKKIIP